MKRKMLSFILILTLIISASPLTGFDFNDIFTTASAEKATFTHGDFEYTVSNGVVEITDWLGEDTTVYVPYEIDGMYVTSVGNGCFNPKYTDKKNSENKKNIQKIIIAEGIQKIRDSVFANCESLEEIVFPNSITYLGSRLFARCVNLKELTLPGSDFSYDSSFLFSDSSIEKINFAEGMTKIPASLLNNSNVKTVTIPSSVKTIDAKAFYYTVETVIVDGALPLAFYPNCVESLQFMLRKNSRSLIEILFRHMPCSLPNLDNYDVSFDSASGYWKCEYVGTDSPEIYNDRSFDYMLNENGEAVLLKYTSYNDYVVIPDNVGFAGVNYGVVAEIGSDVFADTYAKKVIIPSTVKKIGDFAFRNSDVTDVSIPDSVEEIGKGAFYGCNALETLILPESITEIGIKAFENCENLKSINWPSKVKYVPADAFWNCKNLNDFSIFENVEIISGGAFIGCGSLVVDKFGDNLKEIGDFAFMNAGLTKDSGIHATINDETFPEGLEYIGDRAFCYNKTIKKLTIPESVSHIGRAAFGESSLEEVVLSDNLKEITDGAFAFTPLKSVKFPAKLEKIGRMAFYDCCLLEGIDLPDTVTYIGEEAFEACESVTSLKIPPLLETISDRAFVNLDSLTEIHIPSTVKTIGNNAFAYCDNVVKITIENGVESIGNGAFMGNKIKEITIPESVRMLGNGIIDDTETEVVYYNSANFDKNWHRSISTYKYSIFNTDYLKKIVFGNKVNFVPACFAMYNEALEEVVFSDAIEEIDYFAFEECSSLKNITLPQNLKIIEPGAFCGCSSLASVIIPKKTELISLGSFEGCSSLKTVTFLSDATEIENSSFDYLVELTFVCGKNSKAYDYAVKHDISVRTYDTSPKPAEKQPAQNKTANDYFKSFFDSILDIIKEFFAQFRIISR